MSVYPDVLENKKSERSTHNSNCCILKLISKFQTLMMNVGITYITKMWIRHFCRFFFLKLYKMLYYWDFHWKPKRARRPTITRNKISLDKYESVRFPKTDNHVKCSLKGARLSANTRWHMRAKFVEFSCTTGHVQLFFWVSKIWNVVLFSSFSIAQQKPTKLLWVI